MCSRAFALAAILAALSFSAQLCRAQSTNTNKSKKPAASVSVTTTAVQTPNSYDAGKAGAPIATVDGQPIYESDLASTVEPRLAPLRTQERAQEYQVKKQALGKPDRSETRRVRR